MKIGVDDSTTTPSRFITISVVCCLMSKIRGGGDVPFLVILWYLDLQLLMQSIPIRLSCELKTRSWRGVLDIE